MIVLSDSVDRTIVSSFFWTKHRNTTDGRTDLPWLLQRRMRTAVQTSECEI